MDVCKTTNQGATVASFELMKAWAINKSGDDLSNLKGLTRKHKESTMDSSFYRDV